MKPDSLKRLEIEHSLLIVGKADRENKLARKTRAGALARFFAACPLFRCLPAFSLVSND